MNLAMMEIRLTLSEILKTFSFTLADESMKDERIAYEMLLTSRPHKKLPVFVQLRKYFCIFNDVPTSARFILSISVC